MDDKQNVLLQAAQSEDAPQPAKSAWATASFALGVLTVAGLLFGNLLFPAAFLFLAFIPAIFTGHYARRQFRGREEQWSNRSMATFGLAVGYFGLAISLFAIALLIGGASITPAE